jgi:hypothetical protein
LGSGGICGVDILGIEGVDYASVVEKTQRYREAGLPNKYIVIENVDEFLYCLDTGAYHYSYFVERLSTKYE